VLVPVFDAGGNQLVFAVPGVVLGLSLTAALDRAIAPGVVVVAVFLPDGEAVVGLLPVFGGGRIGAADLMAVQRAEIGVVEMGFDVCGPFVVGEGTGGRIAQNIQVYVLKAAFQQPTSPKQKTTIRYYLRRHQLSCSISFF